MKLKKRLLPVLIVFAMLIAAAFSLTGCNSKEAASVTFMVDNSVYGIVKVRDGSESLPEDPTKELYRFDGWYEDRELNTQFDFSDYCESTSREDIIVYAGFTYSGETYKVTLNGNGGLFGTDTVKSVNVRERETVNSVTLPVRENYVLKGWSENKAGTLPWNLSTDKVTSDTVLYAVWARVYTVTFDAGEGSFNGNSSETEIKVTEGYDLTEPDEPERNNRTFLGWATRYGATEPDWDFEKNTVTSDITLYAVWQNKVTEYNVEYVLNYEGAKNEIKSTVRGLIAYEPEREGYIFNGWWNSDGEKDNDGNYILTAKVDITKIITEDGVKVYASWIDEDDICSVLAAPRITVSGSTISWTASEGAKEYSIVIWSVASDEEHATVRTTVYETSYTLDSSYSQNTYRVKVRANGDGYTTVNSAWSAVSSFNHKALATPLISFDLTTSTVSWSAVRNADEYELYIDDELIELTENAFEYDLSNYEAGEYRIKVIVTAEGYAPATASATVKKLKLKTPEVTAIYNKTTKAYELRWKAVSYADSYILKISCDRYAGKTVNTYYSISESDYRDKGEFTYKIDAFNSRGDYLISDAKTVKVGKPTEITIKTEGSTDNIRVENGLASFCRVNFDSKGGSAISQQVVSPSIALNYPAVPKREGYVFTGWYSDYKCTKLFDFTATITQNTTLYAGWFEMPTDTTHLKNYANAPYPVGYGSGVGVSNLTTSGTSYAKQNYIYYCALNSGDFSISYTIKTGGTRYGTYFYAYNLTKNEVILSSTLVTTAAEYPVDYEKVSFTADVGDIIFVSAYRSNESYYTDYSVFFHGGEAPEAGGKLPDNILLTGSTFYVTDDKTFKAGQGSVIKLTAPEDETKKFLGWYGEDGKLVSEEEIFYYTVEGATTLTAKWE